MADASHILFVGIGSPHGDDQIGWRVADELTNLTSQVDRQEHEDLEKWQVRKAKSPVDVLNWLDSRGLIRRLIICDACRSAATHGGVGTGTVHCWIWPTEELESIQFTGSHDMGIAAVLDLARTLDRLPPKIDIWGIEIDSVEPAADISACLEHTASLAAQRIAWSTR